MGGQNTLQGVLLLPRHHVCSEVGVIGRVRVPVRRVRRGRVVGVGHGRVGVWRVRRGPGEFGPFGGGGRRRRRRVRVHLSVRFLSGGVRLLFHCLAPACGFSLCRSRRDVRFRERRELVRRGVRSASWVFLIAFSLFIFTLLSRGCSLL